jgi:hypothetical protein
MNVIWTDELWNMLHILAPLVANKDYKVFYEWITLLSQDDSTKLNWLSTQPLYDHSNSVSWMNKFHQLSYPKWKPNDVYYTKDRMTKDVWGPYIWKWLHRMSYHSSVLTQQSLQYIVKLLPCPVCKKHAPEYINKHPFTDDMVTWTIDFHNHVSDRLNKEYGTKKKIFTIKEAYTLYH